MSFANSYSCVVYPEDGRPFFALPHCTLSRLEEDKIDFGLAEKTAKDSEFLPQFPTETNRPEKLSERNDIARSAHGGPLQYNARNSTYTCPAYNPNGRFCGNGHRVPVIIRCKNGIGQAASCSNNLAGKSPKVTEYPSCWETSPISGDAGCSKK